MANRVVVRKNRPDADTVEKVTGLLRARGVEIVEQEPHMLLVSGDKETVGHALSNAQGWSVSDLTTVPPPTTRFSIKGPP
jgi:hypothetical protein